MSFLDRSRGTDEVAADLLLLWLGGTALLDELFVRCHTDKIRMIMNFKFLLLSTHNHRQPINIDSLRTFKKKEKGERIEICSFRLISLTLLNNCLFFLVQVRA